MQRTTSGAAGNGLYTTIKYMRGASGIGIGTTIKHLLRTTSGAAGKGLGATMKYLRHTTSTAAKNGLSATIIAAHFKHAATRQPRRKPTVETCVDTVTTAKLRPQASVLALRGANQLLRPASTTPRSYGRRHRSWHYEPQAQTNC
jgi:hypothetical protein